MKKLSLLFTLFISFGLQAQEAYFTSSPSLTPDGSQIVFAYVSNLWIVSSTGGEARRLTAIDGNESFPRVSPDGQWVAFTGESMGNEDIYLIPIDGGEIKRLTYHSATDRTETWSWDSKTIYFRSNRENRLTAYHVGVEGGTPKRLVSHYFNWPHNLAIHPDGRVFFNESWESSNQIQRKRYVGEFNPDIKTYHPKTGAYEELTTHDGKDMWATIDKNGTVYFVSDMETGQSIFCTYAFYGHGLGLLAISAAHSRLSWFSVFGHSKSPSQVSGSTTFSLALFNGFGVSSLMAKCNLWPKHNPLAQPW